MSTHKYLDNTGLGEVWSKIKNLTSRKTASIPFGQVDSTSTATVFTATVDGITELRDGVCVYLTNGVVTSASGWTLNINNLGAKPVYQSMAAAGRVTTTFNVAYTALFVYNSSRVDGGCWDYYYGYNSNDNTLAYQVRTNQAVNTLYSALTKYKICFTMFDGKILPSTSVSNSTGTTKTLTTDSFDPYGAIYYYNTTTEVAAGESPSASYMWLLYPTVDLRYGFNTGTTLVAKDNIYIKCSPQTNGSVKLAGDDCIVQALPSTEDGYVYIYLGKAFDTYRIVLDINHPVYYYKDRAVRLWTNISIPIIDVQDYNGTSLLTNGIATLPEYLEASTYYVNTFDIYETPNAVNVYKDRNCTEYCSFSDICPGSDDSNIIRIGFWDGENIVYHLYNITFVEWHLTLNQLDGSSQFYENIYNDIMYGSETWYSNAHMSYSPNKNAKSLIGSVFLDNNSTATFYGLTANEIFNAINDRVPVYYYETIETGTNEVKKYELIKIFGENNNDYYYFYSIDQDYANKIKINYIIATISSNDKDSNTFTGTVYATEISLPSSTIPIMNGVAAIGTSTDYARADHIHPSDASKASVLDVLTKTNTTSYSPTGDYHPATKKYVDDLSLDISNNIIQLKRGTTVQSSITLPVYNGGVSS